MSKWRKKGRDGRLLREGGRNKGMVEVRDGGRRQEVGRERKERMDKRRNKGEEGKWDGEEGDTKAWKNRWRD